MEKIDFPAIQSRIEKTECAGIVLTGRIPAMRQVVESEIFRSAPINKKENRQRDMVCIGVRAFLKETILAVKEGEIWDIDRSYGDKFVSQDRVKSWFYDGDFFDFGTPDVFKIKQLRFPRATNLRGT